MPANNSFSEKNLTIVNFSIVIYFISIWLINRFEIDFTIIGVFRELLTIPALLAQLVFLFISIRKVLQHKASLVLKLSILALTVCSVLTISSFF